MDVDERLLELIEAIDEAACAATLDGIDVGADLLRLRRDAERIRRRVCNEVCEAA